MQKTRFLAILAILVSLTGSLWAQSQEGSVAIAEKIRPAEETAVLDSLSRCVAELKATGTPDKDARATCLKMASIDAETTKKVANEAADATKSSRPIFVSSRYGYGRLNQGYSRSRGGYGRSQQQRVEEARLQAERQAAESKARQERRAAESKARQERLAAEAKVRGEKRVADAAARQERLEAAKKLRKLREAKKQKKEEK